MRTLTSAVPEQDRPVLPGEALTRRAVTVITAAIVAMTFAFSLGNRSPPQCPLAASFGSRRTLRTTLTLVVCRSESPRARYEAAEDTMNLC